MTLINSATLEFTRYIYRNVPYVCVFRVERNVVQPLPRMDPLQVYESRIIMNFTNIHMIKSNFQGLGME